MGFTPASKTSRRAILLKEVNFNDANAGRFGLAADLSGVLPGGIVVTRASRGLFGCSPAVNFHDSLGLFRFDRLPHRKMGLLGAAIVHLDEPDTRRVIQPRQERSVQSWRKRCGDSRFLRI